MTKYKDEQTEYSQSPEQDSEAAAVADGSAELLDEAGEAAGTEAGDDGLWRQLQEAREELRAKEEQMMRLAAEFENYKKRMQRERETTLKYAEEELLRDLLPTLDNLERAIEQGRNTEDVTALLEGVEMTYEGFLATLQKFGIKPLAGEGEAFDPNFHEAMAMEDSDQVPANTVINEYQKGYLYKDRLLRAAKVVVSGGG